MPLTKLNRLLKFVKVSISEMRRKSASKIYENPTNIDLYVHIMYFNSSVVTEVLHINLSAAPRWRCWK